MARAVKPCKIKGCVQRSHVKGYCKRHLDLLQRKIIDTDGKSLTNFKKKSKYTACKI